MCFHAVKDALQEWVWVGSGLAINDRWGCDWGAQEGWATEGGNRVEGHMEWVVAGDG